MTLVNLLSVFDQFLVNVIKYFCKLVKNGLEINQKSTKIDFKIKQEK